MLLLLGALAAALEPRALFSNHAAPADAWRSEALLGRPEPAATAAAAATATRSPIADLWKDFVGRVCLSSRTGAVSIAE